LVSRREAPNFFFTSWQKFCMGFIVDIFQCSESVVHGLTIIHLDDATTAATYSGINVQWRSSVESSRPKAVRF